MLVERWLDCLSPNVFRPRCSDDVGLFFGTDHILLLFAFDIGVSADFPQLLHQLDVCYVDFMRPRTEKQVTGILIAQIWRW